MIRVLVDSAADYRGEELAAKNIEMVALNISVNDTDSYRDELELPRSELYRLMQEDTNTLKTSQPSPQDFVEKFEMVKAAGDEIICILLSSALSGTYQSATIARDIVDYDKIYIVDSLTATVGIKLLADYALELIDAGLAAKEIVEILEMTKGKVKIKAVVDTLKYLYLGGRVSKTTAVVADAVTIKPGIYITEDGRVGIGSKYLGVCRAVADITKQMKSAQINTDFPAYIIYSQNDENAHKLCKFLEDAGIAIDSFHELGATLGVHIGPGAFGIIYVEK